MSTLRPALLTDVRRMIDEEDADNSNFTDGEIYDYLNQAIRYLGTDLEWPLQLAQATSVADQATYTLPEDFISLSDVYFDNKDLIIIDRSDLSAINTSWQDSLGSLPRYCYKQDNAKFGLYPKPDADHAGLAIQIQYIKIPPDLSDDVTAPDLHPVFHDALPFYAAFRCEFKLGNSKRAGELMTLYDQYKKRIEQKVQRFSDDLMRFRWADPRSRVW